MNEIYNTSIDLSLGAEVENTFRCLEADISLDTITMLLNHEMFPDARALLTCADRVYVQAGDLERSTKVAQLQKFVSQFEAYRRRMRENDFQAAVEDLSQLQELAADLSTLRPLSILSPEGADWSSGANAQNTIKERAKSAGESDMATSRKLFEESNFDLSLEMLDKVHHAFEWVARSENDTNWEETSGINLLRKKCLAGKAQAEGHELMTKGKELMKEDKYEEAIQYFADSQSKFALGEQKEREEEVRCLGAVAQGLISFKQAEEFYEKKEFQDCLSLLGMALVSFEDGKNEEKQKATKSFQARVKGDQVMQAYQPALDKNDYDKAVEVLVKASEHYRDVGEAKLVLTREEAQEQVAVVARRDGEKYRTKAQVALSQRKTEEVRRFIDQATACFKWVGSDLKAAGIMNIQKDLAAIELKEKAENNIKEAFFALKKKEFESADKMLQEAHSTYRSADAFSQVNQTFAIILCLKADVALEEHMSSSDAGDNAKLLDLLINAEEVFSSAQSVKGKNNGSWPAYLQKKYVQLENGVSFFRAWAQFTGSNTGRSKALMTMDEQHQHLLQFQDQWLLPFTLESLVETRAQCQSQYSMDPRKSSLGMNSEGEEEPGANASKQAAEDLVVEVSESVKQVQPRESLTSDLPPSGEVEESKKEKDSNPSSGSNEQKPKDMAGEDPSSSTDKQKEKDPSKEDAAATTIQCKMRQNLAVKKVEQLKNDKNQQQDQDNQGKNECPFAVKESHGKKEEINAKDHAATKIQSKVRQRQATKRVEAMKVQQDSQQETSTIGPLLTENLETHDAVKDDAEKEVEVVPSYTVSESDVEEHDVTIDENSDDVFDMSDDEDDEEDDDL